MRLLQSHLQSLEKFQTEAAQPRKNKDERDQQFALTVELKAIEELLVMKKSELKAFDSEEVDSDGCANKSRTAQKAEVSHSLMCGSNHDDSL
jgi:hypothetical protein